MKHPTDISLEIKNGVKLDLVSVRAGRFEMGSHEYASSQPVHRVEITTDFLMGKYPITQEQYQTVMAPTKEQTCSLMNRIARILRWRDKSNPSQFKGHPKNPVEMVSWDDAQRFCKRLAMFLKRPVMLPTEAQWEYACRAETVTRFNTGETEADLARAGWYSGNSSYRPHKVGQKEPNARGLYDMHGNVWEWCADWYTEKYQDGMPSVDPLGPKSEPVRKEVVF